MRRRILSGLCLLWLVAPASAGELAGVSMPDSVTVEGKTLALNGMGLREKLWIDVYVGGLYLEQKSADAEEIMDSEQIKHLHMQFLHKKVGTKKLTGAWSDGLKANARDQLDQLQDGLGQLNSWMEEMVKGDEMAFTSIPGQGLLVEVKGEKKGVIDDEQFSMAFWSIFLGEKPPTDKLKQGLLGGS